MRSAGQSFVAALLGAFAMAFPRTTANPAIDVVCPSQQNVTLTIADLTASYQCSSTGVKQTQMDKSFVVNVDVEMLVLALASSSVDEITFSSSLARSRPMVTPSKLDFTNFSQLKSLVFTNVAMGNVELTIQNSTTDIHILNSTITDLSLPLPAVALNRIDLSGTTITQLPRFLYEKDLPSNMNITLDLSSINGQTQLTTEQLNTLESNLQTFSMQPWAQEYSSSCKTIEISGTTVPAARNSKTVTCGYRNPSASSRSAEEARRDIGSDRSSLNPANDLSTRNGSGVSKGALAAIIVAVAVIVIALSLAVLRSFWKRKNGTATSPNEAAATLMTKGEAADKGSFISNDEFLRNFRLPQSDIALVKSVGTGRLWIGEYKGEKVILKRVESEVTDSYVTKAVMAQARTFATISHPNITNLLGVTWLAGTDFAVLTEFMDKGNLKAFLSNTYVDLNVSSKLQMCSDVASALAYLHDAKQNLCAKQLSSRKVLVDKTMKCKLSLFECVLSCSKFGSASTTSYSYGMGEIAWLPPEVITRSSPMDSRKTNIYAFGVLVCEIFTRVSPYQSLVEAVGNTMSDVELIRRVQRQEQLLPHENRSDYFTAPASVRQLVEQCLSYAPMSRPTAKDIVDVLHNARTDLASSSL